MSDDTAASEVTSPLLDYLRFLAFAAGAAGLLAAVGWLPSRRLGGADGVTALLVACALCWLASALGGVPVLLAARERRQGTAAGRPPPHPLSAVLGASLVRLVSVVGLALATALSGLVAVTPLLVWTAIGYLGLLVVDSWYAVGATHHTNDTTNSEPDERD